VHGQQAAAVAARRFDELQQARLERLQLGAAVVDHAVAAFEAQHHAVVQQLDEVDVLVRRLHQPGQQLEELLAAPGFVVQGHEQAVVRPDTCRSPGRLGGGFVEHGADAVARADDGFHGHAAGAGTLLELAYVFEQQLLQRAGLRW
jgi:hypothetical protein